MSPFLYECHVTGSNGEATAFLARVCDEVFLRGILILKYNAVALLPRWQLVLVSGDVLASFLC